MVSIFITSGYLLQSVTEEKENRVVEIVLSSIPSMPLMAGKILGLGGAGLTQVAIWVATAIVALPLLSSQIPDISGPSRSTPPSSRLALVYFVLGYLAYGAIFAAIGALAPGNREAQQYSGFLGFFAAIPFILLLGLHHRPRTRSIVLALALFPLTTPTAMLLILGISDSHPVDARRAPRWSASSLFAVLAAWVSARIFRATVLLYGVRPSLAQLVDAVRTTRRDAPRRVHQASGVSAARVTRRGQSERQVGFHSLTWARAASLSLNQSALTAVYLICSAGHGVLREDGRDRAFGLARAAVDALVWVDEEHPIDALVEVDAVDRADRDAGLVQVSTHGWAMV